MSETFFLTPGDRGWDNAGATAVSLTAEDRARIDALAPPGVAAGDRYANMEDLFGL